MDTSLAFPNAAVGAVSLAAEPRPESMVKKVMAATAIDGDTILPTDKAFVAQVVTARLSGTAFPENPGEIAPAERTLRPYNVPMLPSDKPEPIKGEEEAAAEEDQVGSTETKTDGRDGTSEPIPAEATQTPETQDTKADKAVAEKPASDDTTEEPSVVEQELKTDTV